MKDLLSVILKITSIVDTNLRLIFVGATFILTNNLQPDMINFANSLMDDTLAETTR